VLVEIGDADGIAVIEKRRDESTVFERPLYNLALWILKRSETGGNQDGK
jgi:hypothetical protein